MRLLRTLVLIVFSFIVSVSLSAQDLEQLLETLPNQEAFWTLTVLDESGNKLENFNSDKLIIPASNQKLYTLAAVLDRLGSDFKYTTNIYGDGELIDSTWQGDLIIRGSGDPSISGFLYNDDRYFVFKSYLEQLKEVGIAKIDGNLVGDERYFDSEVYPTGWDWYDLSFYYGVEIAPLSFNNNAVDIIVTADGEVGDRPRVESFPTSWPVEISEEYPVDVFERPTINLINNQEIVEPSKKYDEYYRRGLGSDRIVLASKLPQGYIEKESLSILYAGSFFLESFDAFLKNNGMKFQDYLSSHELIGIDLLGQNNFELETGLEYSEYELLASHSSKPLTELVKWANKESDNFYTEMMLKTLAAEEQGIPGTFENGIKEVRNFLAEQGLDTNLVKMNDGSGLAMGNYTTTGNISKLLYSMKSHEGWNVFYDSFPIAGIDGSIAHRFKGTELYNNIRAKTGYVSGVRTLSGYMTTRSGKQIVFSLATNHFAGKVRPVDNSHQQILQYLYEKY
ncbi:MAG: D-alanyl-D-alanine carboxypeptidase/D-alanyl-D-alanine-endopeptidase [Balneola sp.]|nr:D-alanyl-D-alanine carboxypeptidase/D-alanyl-D-alanine-endopeptidase [Balneola sp.]MBO6651582.1 D-alanyl-D-alanine carboxypeptidase/D-alanyl-D-alanine-endopeptidase [Balneola sp.]MBO6710935.1 D-alanyl-D-alanine carboxypeptidase/D-alanyl-D-alanine-endopeptidase [Balneola sp.]MBO6799622.1 D-alanyl-D-alanine carboxypeptidase/D-alanyl-D-alanine-endopeptidase [Balneola sp.]MBO6870355.1 D-alanyl-D-alanine carboxypeptidase/D-alanyl-D-alanine-endopeptidase [Balneola sp.]